MRVVIAYESMYGNTRQVAEAIAAGFGDDHDVVVEHINDVDPTDTLMDVLVIGVPTHAHGLPRPATRRAAAESARTKYDVHRLEPSAAGPGAREWLQRLPERVPVYAAAFDTRFRPPGWLVGHPSRVASRMLRRHGARPLGRPMSFFVDKHEQLVAGELDRARAWGDQLRQRANEQVGAPIRVF